jgi:hypothetical protein
MRKERSIEAMRKERSIEAMRKERSIEAMRRERSIKQKLEGLSMIAPTKKPTEQLLITVSANTIDRSKRCAENDRAEA